MGDARWDEEAPRSGRFTVVARLGEGGMGTVYEAVDQERDMRVALKTLRRLGPQAVQRFKAEFRRLQDLHHPNLVSLGELVEEQGRWFFTMELVRGRDFLAYVRYGPPRAAVENTWSLSLTPDSGRTAQDGSDSNSSTAESTDELTELQEPAQEELEPSYPAPQRPSVEGERAFDSRRLRQALGQLALGLHALHRAGKVHRDIKPSNILVTAQGRVVLLDFGILADVEGDSTWEPSTVVGTASYMAPEQARGAPPSPQADWYSVGVLLYQALTGEKPFRGTNQQILERKRQVEPLPPQQRVRGLPEDLCLLCTELLRITPERRPSGEEVLRRLGVEQAAREEAWATPALPFVGRQAELQALHLALADGRRGASVVVRVEGESGVGKSRLVRSFLEELVQGRPDTLVLAGRCYERESVPYKGVDGLIDSLARHLRGLRPEERRELRTSGTVPLMLLFPILQGVKDLATDTGRVPSDPLQLRLTAFAALRELLARLAARHPVVLSMDDLQWADRDGAALLDEVLRAPGLLLVATVRHSAESGPAPEVAASRLWQQARVLHLEGLGPAETQALIGRLLGQGEELDAREVRRIARESGGHPLFIDALVRHQRSEEGSARPLRLEEALWARVERLEPQARRLLELLSVADGPLSHSVATHAASLEPAEYARLTASLRAARLAVTTGPAAQDTLEVIHDRVRLAVAPHLQPLERQGWHARLAASLELLQPGRPEALARHWLEAGYLERAARYFLQAAEEATKALAFSHAAGLYRQALELGLWSRTESRRHYVSLGEALSHAGRGAEAAHAFLAAAAAAPPSESRALQRRAAEQYLYSGHMDEGLATVRTVLEALGIRYRAPATQRKALRSLLWQRLWVRLQPLRARAREPQEPPSAEVLERLEVLRSLSSSLATVMPATSFDFHARYMLLALRAGERHHLCRALCLELVYQSRAAPLDRRRMRQLIHQLRAQEAHLADDPICLGTISATLAVHTALMGEFLAARPHFELALTRLKGYPEAQWELYTAWNAGVALYSMTGELAEMHQRMELPLLEARERNNLYGLTALVLGSGTLRWLGLDDPQQGREEANDVISRWSRTGNSLQHYGHVVSLCQVELYEGQSEPALKRLAAAWEWMWRSGLMVPPGTRCRMLDLRARAQLMEAARQGSHGPGEALLRGALGDAQRLQRLGMDSARGIAELVRAAVVAAYEPPQAAAAAYARAAGQLEQAGLGLHAAAARVRQGELMGGEAGWKRVADAERWMKQQGIVRTARMVAMYAPRLTRASASSASLP